jgi:hypothetical protein
MAKLGPSFISGLHACILSTTTYVSAINALSHVAVLRLVDGRVATPRPLVLALAVAH